MNRARWTELLPPTLSAFVLAGLVAMGTRVIVNRSAGAKTVAPQYDAASQLPVIAEVGHFELTDQRGEKAYARQLAWKGLGGRYHIHSLSRPLRHNDNEDG